MIIRRNSLVPKLRERVNKLVKRCVTIVGVVEAWWIRSALQLHAAPTGGFSEKTGLILAIRIPLM